MNDYIVSLVRTYVPLAVGWLVVTFDQSIDTADAAAHAVAIVLIVYYAVVRALERRFPAVGWLLGRPSTPLYE